jgi:hypothetical protein
MELERSFHRTCSQAQAPGEELAGNAGPQAIRYFASLKKGIRTANLLASKLRQQLELSKMGAFLGTQSFWKSLIGAGRRSCLAAQVSELSSSG